jgi:hypothetical protein
MIGRYNLFENYGNTESGHRHYGFAIQDGYAEYVVGSEKALYDIGDMPFDEVAGADTAGIKASIVEASILYQTLYEI